MVSPFLWVSTLCGFGGGVPLGFPSLGTNVMVRGWALHQLTSTTKGASSPGTLEHSRWGFNHPRTIDKRTCSKRNMRVTPQHTSPLVWPPSTQRLGRYPQSEWKTHTHTIETAALPRNTRGTPPPFHTKYWLKEKGPPSDTGATSPEPTMIS
jgi:hypothetical protein